MNLIIIVALLSVLDISLTNLCFFLKEKKGVLDYHDEANLIPRLIIKHTPKSLSILVGCIFSTSGLVLISLFFEPLKYFIIGILVMVNFDHYHNLCWFNQNWNNKPYWKLYRKAKKVVKR